MKGGNKKKKETEEYLRQCPGIKPFPYENINNLEDFTTKWINGWCEWGNVLASKLDKDMWFSVRRDDVNEPFKIHPPPKSPAAVSAVNLLARTAGAAGGDTAGGTRVPNLMRQNMAVGNESAAVTPKKRY